MRLPRWRHGLPDAHDAPFGSGHGAFVFLVERTRQDDIGMARRLRHEKVDDAEEFELLQGGAGVVGVRQGDEGVKADTEEPANLTPVDGLHHLRGGVAHARQLVGGDPPALGHDTAMLGIVEVSPARQLITALAVLPPTLAIALPSNGRVAAP